MKLGEDTEHLPLRERNRQRIIQRIVKAAIELFHTVGYEQTTMDNIAEKAEVSRGTLFNYFPTKTSLLIPFASELFKHRVQPEVRSYLEKQPTTLDTLRFLFLEIGEQVLTLPDIELALQQEFSPSPPAMKVSLHHVGYIETLLTIVHHGRQRGEVRTDIPPEQLARYIGVLYVSLIHPLTNQFSAAQYASEVEILLTFLRTALRP
ncbi:MAG: TetR/AcrR family transcriptional regulator [Ktedonobacteraceae bacterium]|nr:TetR/AcrR family transcriptional regulator [Ktedonobacteraceae bacterium]